MEKEEIKLELLKIMNEISTKMRALILMNYYDKYGNEQKYCLSMIIESYQTVDVFCYTIQNIDLTQAGLLLRQLLEQVAISYILVEHPETLPKYIEHFNLKLELSQLAKGKQIDRIAEKFGIENNPNALKFLDYGWLGFKDIKKCSEDEMLKYAGFKDILPWRKVYLDKFAHSSFVTINLLGVDNSFPIIDNFVEIAAKLFDYLCVAFHNITHFDFVFDNNNLFSYFRDLYSNYRIS